MRFLTPWNSCFPYKTAAPQKKNSLCSVGLIWRQTFRDDDLFNDSHTCISTFKCTYHWRLFKTCLHSTKAMWLKSLYLWCGCVCKHSYKMRMYVCKCSYLHSHNSEWATTAQHISRRRSNTTVFESIAQSQICTYVQIHHTTFMCPRSIAGWPSSQALPSFLITAHPNISYFKSVWKYCTEPDF